MSDNLFPIAKLLMLGEAEPWTIVTLDDVQWWRKITPMETASREDRIRCPFCDRRFEFCSGPKRGSYFRHRKGEGSCMGPDHGGGGASTPYPPTRTMWIRYKFARLLRHLLPPGAVVDEKPALTRLDGHMVVTLPDGGQLAVEVDCSPAGFKSLVRRWEEHHQAHRPVIWVFAGDKLVTSSMRQHPGAVATTLDPLLLAFMEKGAPNRPKAKPIVDRAYRAFTNYITLNLTADEPRSLLLYLPSERDEELGALVGLRGLMPGRKDVWVGTLLRAEYQTDQPNPVRFSRRRGFYFASDVEIVKRHRRQRHEERRRERELLANVSRPPQTAAPRRGVVSPPGAVTPSSRNPCPLPAPKLDNLTDMVMASPEQWVKAMLDHFLGQGKPFTIAEACRWVDRYYRIHPSMSPHDSAFLIEMRYFWEKVAAKGSVKVVESRPVCVIPLK